MRARGLCRLAYRRARLQSDLHACIRLCWLAVVFACVHLPRACMQTREQACRATCWLARALWTYAQSRAGFAKRWACVQEACAGVQSYVHACTRSVQACRLACALAVSRTRRHFRVIERLLVILRFRRTHRDSTIG